MAAAIGATRRCPFFGVHHTGAGFGRFVQARRSERGSTDRQRIGRTNSVVSHPRWRLAPEGSTVSSSPE
jgi:hypothetical protein